MFQRHSSVLKFLTAAVVGGVVGLLTPRSWPVEARSLVGWVAFCAAVMVRVWLRVWRASPQETKRLATLEDDSRAVAGTMTLVTALVSLVGVGFTLHEANGKNIPEVEALLLTGLAVLTVAASWFLVHTEYMLHYARRYYTDGGGVSFLDGPDGNLKTPTYRDFAYLAFVLGMTYQVSDTNITSRKMRQLVLGHSLLSYLFGTVIVAVTINGVAGIIGSGG